MKIVTIAAGVLVSQLAFGFGAGYFEGSGTWKDPKGGTGTWSEETEIKEVEGGVEITSSVKISMNGTILHEESGSIKIAFKQNGFYDVLKDGAVVGHGYCFEKTCHYDYVMAGEHGEETLHFYNDTIYKIGSARGEYEGETWVAAFQGELKPVKK